VDEFRYELWRNARTYMEEDSDNYRRPIVSNVYHEPMDLFDRHLYEKGSLVLHMLRYVLGDDGFWKSMRYYVQTFQRQNVITTDLRRAIEEATGRNLDWFFDQWVYKGGHPTYEVSWSWDGEQKQASVTVKQTQKTDELSPLFRMPVVIAFHGKWGEQRMRIEVADRESRVHVALPERPTMVRFDPGNWILKSLEFKKDAPELIEQLRADDDSTGRIRAARALGKLATLPAVEALTRAVREDAFWGVRAEAAKALGDARTPAARTALVGLLSVEHPKVRRAVIEALGEFRHADAAEALKGVLERGDPSYFVEAEAAKALGKTRQDGAYDTIIAALDRPSWNNIIQQRALDGLGELKDDRGLVVALDWSSYGRPQSARAAAVGAIEKLGKDKDEAVDRLIDLLDDHWLAVRIRAARALAALKADRAVPALERMTARELDGRALRAARVALRDIRKAGGQDAATKKLQERLDTLEQENRELKERLERLETQGR
jgi:aminopeptidase N